MAEGKETSQQPKDAPRPQDIRPAHVGDTQVLSGPTPHGAPGPQPIRAGKPIFSGVPGGPFNIHGARFDQIGTVSVNGKPVTVTRWEHNLIKGVLPPDVERGDVEIVDGTGKVQKTQFGGGGERVAVTVACPMCKGSGKVESETR